MSSVGSGRRHVHVLKPQDRVGDRYEVTEELGRGAIGIVYRAWDVTLRRDVVVKVLISRDVDGYYAEKFADEKAALTRIRHPGVVGILDSGELRSGQPYLVLEYVGGITLRQDWQERWPELAEIGNVMAQIGRALHHAHLWGVIHRDLKPENVMVEKAGGDAPVVRVIDFGLATVRNAQEVGAVLTGVAGTPPYMAFEQFWGKPSRASDIFAMAVIAYEGITGRQPFVASNPVEMVHLQQQGPVPPSERRSGLPAGVDELLLSALHHDQQKRPANARTFGERLARLLGSRVTPPPPVQGSPGDVGWAPKDSLPPVPKPPRAARAAVQIVADAFAALRDRRLADAHVHLDEAAPRDDAQGASLRGAIAQCRGTLHFLEGRSALAITELTRALDLLGPDNYATGRVVDALGMTYAGLGSFCTARALFEHALLLKQRQNDQPGLAQGEGQLGRLCLELGLFDEAETHFQRDLEISQRLGDLRGVAHVRGHLGRVALFRESWEEAARRLDEALAQCHGFAGAEGAEAWARKDRALAAVELGRAEEAPAHLLRARALFGSFTEGLTHVAVAEARVHQAQGRFDEAERSYLAARKQFEQAGDGAEAARVLVQLARLRRQRGAAAILVAQAYLEALRLADESRHECLFAAIEAELREWDALLFHRHAHERIADRAVGVAGGGLERRVMTVMSLGLPGAASPAADRSVEVLKELHGELGKSVRCHRGAVLSLRADGLVAVFRGAAHAVDAVRCAHEVAGLVSRSATLHRVLGLPPLRAALGVASGEVSLAAVSRGGVIAGGAPVVAADHLAGITGFRVTEPTRQLAGDDALFAEAVLATLQVGGTDTPVWEMAPLPVARG